MKKLIGILMLLCCCQMAMAYCHWVYVGEGMYIYRQQCQDGGGEPYWSGACAWTSDGGMEYPCFSGIVEADLSLVQNQSTLLALAEPKCIENWVFIDGDFNENNGLIDHPEDIVAWYSPSKEFIPECYWNYEGDGVYKEICCECETCCHYSGRCGGYVMGTFYELPCMGG